MSKMNLLIDLKGYDGNNANTCKTKFSRNAQYIGIEITDETVQEKTIASGNSEVLFSVAPVDAKKFIYLETTGECDISVNGIVESTLKPIVINDTIKSGVYLKSSDIESVEITNNGASDLKIYYITSK